MYAYYFLLLCFAQSMLSGQSVIEVATQTDFQQLINSMKSSLTDKIMQRSHDDQWNIDPHKDIIVEFQLSRFKSLTQTARLKVVASCVYQDQSYPPLSGTCQGSQECNIKISQQLFVQNTKKKSSQCLIL